MTSSSLQIFHFTNGLKLNTSKCVKISYSHFNIKTNQEYYILDDKIEEVNIIRDLYFNLTLY